MPDLVGTNLWITFGAIAFTALLSFLASRYGRGVEYGREDQRLAAEAARDRAKVESARIDSIFESHSRLAAGLEARIRQQDKEIVDLRAKYLAIWEKAEDLMKTAAECERANNVLQREKDALARRVTVLELRISELGNKTDSDYGG